MICEFSQFIQEEKRFLERLDHIITNKEVKIITIRGGSEDIARQAGKNIVLNFDYLEEFVKANSVYSGISDYFTSEYGEYFKLVKGLNYHEIAHLIYSPLYPLSFSDDEREAANILEDQRIEALFTEKFRNAPLYFANNILKLGRQAYHTVYGRRFFLPEDLVAAYRERALLEGYTEEELKEIENIIDAYLITSKSAELFELVKRFAAVLKLKKNKDGEGEKEKGEDKGDGAGGETDKGTGNDKSDETDDETEKEEKTNEDPGMPSDIEVLTDTKQRVPGGTERKRLKKRLKKEKIVDRVEKEIETEDVNKEEDIEKTISEFTDIISKSLDSEIEEDMITMGVGTEAGSHIPTFIQERIDLKNELKSYLKVLKSDLSESYVRKQRRGRVDLRSAMGAGKTQSITVFKRFRPSKVDKVKMAVTILIDGSGSMKGEPFTKATSGSWILSHALEEVGSKVLVMEYSNRYTGFVAKQWDEKMDRQINFLHGGTEPEEHLRMVLNELKRKKTKDGIHNLVNIILTDGKWHGAIQSEDIISEMQHEKIKTVEIHIAGNIGIYEHNSEYMIRVNNIEKLPEQMKGVIEGIARDIRRGI